MRHLAWIAFLLAQSLVAPGAWAMTPEEAYASIPHRRTQFDRPGSRIDAQKALQLERLFALTDEGVVLRAEGMRAQARRDTAQIRTLLARYDGLIAKLSSEGFMAEIASARDGIVEALRHQRAFLASRPDGGMRFVRQELASTPDVKQASARLHGAYDILMKAFPRESARNQTSFYDHLCALDYL